MYNRKRIAYVEILIRITSGVGATMLVSFATGNGFFSFFTSTRCHDVLTYRKKIFADFFEYNLL